MIAADTFTAALDDWRAALGPERVLVDGAALAAAATATFATDRRPRAVLRPATRAQVQQCVRIANTHRTPLYPVSTGRNWGFGSAVPAADGCALLHLGDLDRIVAFDERLAYVTVEPGVTQCQLYEFLQERRSRLWLDATASSAECSLIGNVLERGYGFTPYGDHFAHVCNLEVVLPDGECIRTGQGRFPGARGAPVHRWGVGPALDGLFTQSNLGIVTEMTLWLMPAPEAFQVCYFKGAEDGDLERLIDAVAPLKLDGTLRGAVHFYNPYNVLATVEQYPWREAAGRTPLPANLLEAAKRRWDVGAWNGAVGLYGTRGEVAEARRRLERALRGKVWRLKFLDDRLIRMAPLLARPYRWRTGRDLMTLLGSVLPGYRLHQGVPSEGGLLRPYWRKKAPPPGRFDPDADRCGFIWLTATAPLAPTEVRGMVDIAGSVIAAHGFEPLIGLNALTERCVYGVVGIAYDRDEPGEDDRALRCHDELLAQLTAAGYYPARLGLQSMDAVQGEDTYARLLRTLKDALDPNHILAPGRYVPAPTTPAGGRA